jgi:hypothetical protein
MEVELRCQRNMKYGDSWSMRRGGCWGSLLVRVRVEVDAGGEGLGEVVWWNACAEVYITDLE